MIATHFGYLSHVCVLHSQYLSKLPHNEIEMKLEEEFKESKMNDQHQISNQLLSNQPINNQISSSVCRREAIMNLLQENSKANQKLKK